MIKQLTLIAVLVLLALPSLVLTQTAYVIPRPINLDPIVRRTFRTFYVRSYPGGPIQGLSTDGFYPIGWSRGGKFAYYSEPVDEACGCYFAELHIIDLRTDKVLWEFKNKPMERMDEKGTPIEDDVRKLWSRNVKMFSEKLSEHGIIQTARFPLLPRSFSSAGKTYTAKVTAPKGNDDDGLRRVRNVSVELMSPALGKKTLYTANYAGNMFTSPLDVAVAGAFKSPYENRAAIVLINAQRGWEGPPHTVEVQIAGADLTSGFRK